MSCDDIEGIVSLYGPLATRAASVLREIVYQLEVLSQQVQEEKTLGDNIQINNYVTPYKKATTHAKTQITNYQHRLLSKSSACDPDLLYQEFKNFKMMTKIDLEKAFRKTETLVKRLQENISTQDVKSKINNTVKNRIKDAISNIKDKAGNTNRYFDLADKIKAAYANGKLKTVQEDHHKKMENELNFVAECLLEGDLDLLTNHIYFQENPQDLKHYQPDNKNLNKRLLKVFLKTFIRKITADDDLIKNKKILYQRMIAHINKLCIAETLSIFSHSRSRALGQYIKDRVAQEGRAPLGLEEESKEKRLHNRIKQYITKKSKSAATLEQHNQPQQPV